MSYKEKIEDLGFNRRNGLFFFSENDWKNRFPKRVEEVIELKLKPDAIFEFNNEPFILFFKNRQNTDIHQWCWNLNSSPLIIIIDEENQVKIYNGFSFDNKKRFLRVLLDDEKDLGDFTYINLVSGKFLEKYGKQFEEKNRVDYKLLENIKTARDILITDHRLPPGVVNSLIGRLLFVRYLIDRKVKVGEYGALSGDNLLSILTDKEKTYKLFNYLRIKFNGDLFPIDDKHETQVNSDHLDLLARLLKGHELKTGQMNLFEFYDFSVIPIEFISNIYEFFLGEENQRKEAAYYTPPFLVDYILKNTVDSYFERNPGYRCKVLDPACGSGIFLVETLRRLIHRYLELNPYCLEDRENYKEELRKLLLDHIFGIDKDKNAINIAVFSLYITLLDYQEPKDIENFKFPELVGSNFFNVDFFDIEGDFNARLKDIGFDFIIGNPPWGNPSIQGAENKYIDYCKKQGVEIGRKEISQAFLLRVSDFSIEDTGCALIVTSKNLYNIESRDFREYFLANFKIDRIFELSSVRRQLFSKSKKSDAAAVAPAAIIFYRCSHGEDTDENIVKHISLKPNPIFDLFKIFIIEKYDYKDVLQGYFKKYDWLFKTLVYGNILDFYFIKRLKEDYEPINKIVRNESYFLVKHGLKRIDGAKKKDATQIYKKNFLDTDKKELKAFFIEPSHEKWEMKQVGFLPDVNLFKCPNLLIKKGLAYEFNVISAVNSSEELVFTDSVLAIKDKNGNKLGVLFTIAGLLSNSLFRYFIINTGSSTGIEREQTHDPEKLYFPYISNERIISIVENLQQNRYLFNQTVDQSKDKILDTSISKKRESLEKKFISLQEKLDNELIDAFELSKQEKALVDYVLKITIPLISGKKNKSLDAEPTNEAIEEYARVFIDHFDKYFKELDKYFSAEIHRTRYVLGINFTISEEKPANNIQWKNDRNDLKVFELLANKSFSEISNDIFVLKDVKGFDKNSFHVIKPNQYRLWHKAIAYLDMMEFADAILDSGRKSSTK